jgi:hypothetical protein
MGTRIVCRSLAIALTAFSCSQLAADEPPAKSLLAQTNWVRFEVCGGRIVPRCERSNQSRQATESSAGETGRQADQRMLLKLDAKGQLTISREMADAAAAGNLLFSQSPAGKVTLTLGGAPPRKLAADDLWQLLLAEQDACRQHLLPLLAELQLGQEWDHQARAVEKQLRARAGQNIDEQRREWQACVAKLASPDYGQRQAADGKLRASGQGVLAFLRQLDPAGLDTEQRRRIRSMLAELPSGGPDSPELVTEWLLTDKRVWLALMNRGELSQRVAAAGHLSKLCGRPVVFDAAASAESRTAQLAELSRMLVDN